MVADSYAQTGPHEFGQIGVECMEGESRHLECLRGRRTAVGTVGKGDIENLTGTDSIFGVGLVKIATTEEQHRIGILRFDVAKLPHHRCYCFLIHISEDQK